MSKINASKQYLPAVKIDMASLSILQIGYRLDNSKKTEEELLDEKDRRDELRGWDPFFNVHFLYEDFLVNQ